MTDYLDRLREADGCDDSTNIWHVLLDVAEAALEWRATLTGEDFEKVGLNRQALRRSNANSVLAAALNDLEAQAAGSVEEGER